MFDPEQVPLSTSEGRRPSSTAGDRMMVGLAVLALTGGLLIAVSRLIPEQADERSQVVATPTPSVQPGSPSPSPTASTGPIRTMTIEPASRPVPARRSAFVSEWVRMRIGVTLLESPSSSRTAGRLHPGEAAHVSDTPPEEGGFDGWLMVDGPISGWIFGDLDNEAMFQRFPSHWQSGSAVYGLASDANRFIAFGWSAPRSAEVLLVSSDGTHWRSSGAPSTTYGRTAASGPDGWLMAGTVQSPDGATATMLWQSADAVTWERLGAFPREMAADFVSLAGSEAGYVLVAYSGGATAVWFSADGLLWTERPLRQLHADGGVRVEATPLGFLIWGVNDPASQGVAAFSADGWTWSEANPIGPGQILDVVADGDHVLAMGRGPGGAHMWKGSIQGQELVWSSDNTAPFRAAVASRMVSDGERAIVLGWDRATETPLWWQRDGLTWQRHVLPAAFGGLPGEAVGGPQGIVAVGQLASAAGRSPVFWHLGEGAIWEREPSAVMPAPAPPGLETCGPKPDDLLGLMNADGIWAATCFGDAPITVRGWSVACEGCYSRSPGAWETEWLAQPADQRVLHLAPFESSDWGALDAILQPSLRGRPPLSRWLEVTGHFDDPEAASCRWTPTLVDEAWYTGRSDVVAGCRARFVVTAVRPVRGP